MCVDKEAVLVKVENTDKRRKVGPVVAPVVHRALLYLSITRDPWIPHMTPAPLTTMNRFVVRLFHRRKLNHLLLDTVAEN